MASAKREPIMAVWGQKPQRGPGAEPLVGVRVAKPPWSWKIKKMYSEYADNDIYNVKRNFRLCWIFWGGNWKLWGEFPPPPKGAWIKPWSLPSLQQCNRNNALCPGTYMRITESVLLLSRWSRAADPDEAASTRVQYEHVLQRTNTDTLYRTEYDINAMKSHVNWLCYGWGSKCGDALACPSHTMLLPQGRSQREGACPHHRLSGIFYEKNRLCWDVGPALLSKITLFSLPEVRSIVFCGPQISQVYGPRCWESSSFEGDDKQTFVEKKSAPSQLL